MNKEVKSHYTQQINAGHEHLEALKIALSNASYNNSMKSVENRRNRGKGLMVHDYVMGYEAGRKDTEELADHAEIEKAIRLEAQGYRGFTEKEYLAELNDGKNP